VKRIPKHNSHENKSGELHSPEAIDRKSGDTMSGR
jgi:hypothetical protein